MMRVLCGSLLFLCLASVAVAEEGDVSQQQEDVSGDACSSKNSKILSVLLVTPPAPGHFIKMVAIGEALVTRGHNVTLCSTEREGSGMVRKTVARIGMNFLSAGQDPFSQEEYLEQHRRMHKAGLVDGTLTETIKHFTAVTQQFAEYFHAASVVEQFDVVVVDRIILFGVACLTKMLNIHTISLQASLEVINLPQWPFPVIFSAFTDNLTFFQRFSLTFHKFAFDKMLSYIMGLQLNILPETCSANYSSYLYGAGGATTPLIVGTAIGFEYPRTLLPMTHYVGSINLKSTEALPGEMDSWLRRKDDRTVVYISMGSSAHLSKGMGEAIVHGIMDTNYSVIWSLRKANRDILEGLNVDKNRFFIAEWIPQQAVLKHNAIAMSIVHGGMGGVTESLYNAVPLIVMPFAVDHWDIAARVQHSGTGVSLDPDSIKTKDIKKAIETVGSEGYTFAAEKLRKVFIQAGGAERAAELVEFYADVGYDHLIPAYAKYEWSWVQYYNVDVYGIILCFICACIYCSIRLCSCICRVFFKFGQKVKTA